MTEKNDGKNPDYFEHTYRTLVPIMFGIVYGVGIERLETPVPLISEESFAIVVGTVIALLAHLTIDTLAFNKEKKLVSLEKEFLRSYFLGTVSGVTGGLLETVNTFTPDQAIVFTVVLSILLKEISLQYVKAEYKDKD